MTSQTYTCRRYRTVGEFRYSADFANASSQIMVSFPSQDAEDGTPYWQPVPFQVADARHSRSRAEQMIAAYFR